MPVYVNYSPLKWQNQDYVQLCFSGDDRFHTPHLRNNKTDFELIKVFIATIKQTIPSSLRNYEPIEKIWFIPETNRIILEKLFVPTNNYTWQKQSDLLDYIITSKAIYDKQQLQAQEARDLARHGHIKAENVEDFFHQFKELPVQTSSMTIPVIETKLKVLGMSKFNKKNYRIIAMQLHPDRNNGDGSKMSELNMLWQEYVKLCPEQK